MNFAIQSVHTTGINWMSVSVIIISIVGAIVACATFIVNRVDKSRNEQRSLIMDAVHAVTDPLVTQLKEININLKGQSEVLDEVRLKQARMEGAMQVNDQNARRSQARMEGTKMGPDEQVSREEKHH